MVSSSCIGATAATTTFISDQFGENVPLARAAASTRFQM
jgi:hypothetical protein